MPETIRNARSGKGLRPLIRQSAREVAAPQAFNRPSLRGSRNSTSVISSRPHAVRKDVERDLARGNSMEGTLVGGTQVSSAIVIAHPNSFLTISPEPPLPEQHGLRSLSPAEAIQGVEKALPPEVRVHTGQHETTTKETR